MARISAQDWKSDLVAFAQELGERVGMKPYTDIFIAALNGAVDDHIANQRWGDAKRALNEFDIRLDWYESVTGLVKSIRDLALKSGKPLEELEQSGKLDELFTAIDAGNYDNALQMRANLRANVQVAFADLTKRFEEQKQAMATFTQAQTLIMQNFLLAYHRQMESADQVTVVSVLRSCGYEIDWTRTDVVPNQAYQLEAQDALQLAEQLVEKYGEEAKQAHEEYQARREQRASSVRVVTYEDRQGSRAARGEYRRTGKTARKKQRQSARQQVAELAGI